MSESKPREYWINKWANGEPKNTCLINPDSTKDTIHVIEISALQSAQARIAELESQVEFQHSQRMEMQNNWFETDKKLESAQAENLKLNEIITQLKIAVNKATDEVIPERDQLKAEIERLKAELMAHREYGKWGPTSLVLEMKRTAELNEKYRAALGKMSADFQEFTRSGFDWNKSRVSYFQHEFMKLIDEALADVARLEGGSK